MPPELKSSSKQAAFFLTSQPLCKILPAWDTVPWHPFRLAHSTHPLSCHGRFLTPRLGQEPPGFPELPVLFPPEPLPVGTVGAAFSPCTL